MSPETMKQRGQRTDQLLTALRSFDLLLPTLHEGELKPLATLTDKISTLRSPLTVTDEEGKERKGPFFVSMPKELTNTLPGTYLGADTFLKEMEVADESKAQEKKLLGNHIGTYEDPAFEYRSESGKFFLNVLHGATNTHALNLARIAKEAQKPDGSFDFSDDQRKQYQQAEIDIIKPAIQNEFTDKNGFCMIEDCIASADSGVAIMKLLAEKEKLKLGSTFRIDVVVATTQGILVLKKYAESLGIKLEINVGYLATGLTLGDDGPNKSRKHANYITYHPEFPKTLRDLGIEEAADEVEKYVYVVGDMGDAARQWKQNPKVKDNSIGEHANKVNTLDDFNNFDLDKMVQDAHDNPTYLFLARGGCFMKAVFDVLSPSLSYLRNTAAMRASRVWAQEEDKGYGVLFESIKPDEYLSLPTM